MEAISKAQGVNVTEEGSPRIKLASSTISGRFFEEGTAFNRILVEAPYLARCSDDKTATLIRPRDLALRFPYMQINRSGMRSWLIFDLDHANSLIWDDAGLPPPNLIVRNRANGHSHLYYAITSVCTTEKARSKPIKYMKAVYAAFADRLKADKEYSSGPVAKTPGHPWWDTSELHNHTYELGELADHVELVVTPWTTTPKLNEVAYSRHCIMFDQLRYYAYSIVKNERQHGDFARFMRSLEAYAHNHNSFHKYGFTANLPHSSLRATVKSVSRWTWDCYRGDARCHRGAMQLDSSLPLAERQTLAAKRTHEVRHKATESKIRAACRGLLQRGEPLHRTAIAALAGVTRQTVGTYAHVLEEVSRPTFVAVLPVDPQHTRPRANLANVLHEPAPGTCWPGSNYGHSKSAAIDQGDREIAEKQSPSSLHVGDQDPKSHHVSGGKLIDTGVKYGVHQITSPLRASLLLCLGDSVDEDSS